MSYLGVCQCDDCLQEKISVIHKHMDTPVLAVCRDCNPRSFEEHAKREIDSWLNGDNTIADPWKDSYRE